MDTVVKAVLGGQWENRIFPFLWLHGEDEAVLRHYMHVIHAANIGAVCVESRPHPDFCGPGWWRDMDVILDEAKKLDMRVWILDDSHFPTGYANGALKYEPDEVCRQMLACRMAREFTGGGTVTIPVQSYRAVPAWQPNLMEQYTVAQQPMRQFADDRLLGMAAVKVDGQGMEDIFDLTEYLNEDAFSVALPAGQWRLYVLYLTRNRGPHRDYINMLRQDSVRLLIDAVYEPHFAHYGAEFGHTIAGFFSDEPEIGNGHLYETGKHLWELDDQPWSEEIEEKLRTVWGGEFIKHLPLLWEQAFASSAKAQTRCTFMDAVTRTVEKDFSRQIGDWCHAHGVEYIGHLIEDNGQHTRTGSSLGHYFRALAGQDMAGIDDIGGQVLPQGEWVGPHGLMGEIRDGEFYHYVLGKLAASAAAIDPRKQGRAMCEIFGNYGWEEGVRLEKYLIDHFLVRGINHFVPHAFTPKAFPDPDCPPHFYAHGHNPQYRHFGALMAYTNRMCALLSGGRHVAPAAILYNAEADWAGDCDRLESAAKALADRQIDYDFLPADVFTQRTQYGTKIGRELTVNGSHYRCLILPQTGYVPPAVEEAAVKLTAAGGTVLRANSGDLPAALEALHIPEVRITPAAPRIRFLHYCAESERYLFVNEDAEPYCGTFFVPESGPCYRYNAWDNTLERLDAVPAADGTAISVKLSPGESMFVIFDHPDMPPSEPLRLTNPHPWNEGWTRSICKSIEYPQFHDAKTVSLPDDAAGDLPLFSGFVRYEKTLHCDTVPDRALLCLTDVGEAAEVFVNGQSLGIRVAQPFLFELAPMLHQRENTVTVEAATTLEREMSTQLDPIRTHLGLAPKVPACPSGLCSHALLDMEETKR